MCSSKFHHGKHGQAQEKAAQGSGGVLTPGRVPKHVWMWHHGLVVNMVVGGWLDLMILKVLSDLDDSVILCLAGG